MTDVIVKIMVEALNILAVATKEIKQGCTAEPSIPPHCAIPLTLGSEKSSEEAGGKGGYRGGAQEIG